MIIDTHCHILPWVDDGPAEIDESVEMAKIAAADGITHIVATPHVNRFYSHNRADAAQRFAAALYRLEYRLKVEGVPIKVMAGAEIADTCARTMELSELGLNKTNYLLVEFPHTHLPADAGDLLFNLVVKGYKPIIAHPERNPSVIENPNRLFELRKAGALVQVTASSLTNKHNSDVHRCAMYLLKKDAVEIIASDAHNTNGRRPVLSEAIKVISKVVGKKQARRMVVENPIDILVGDGIKTSKEKMK